LSSQRVDILYLYILLSSSFLVFFFTPTSTTEIYTLSLHDALPILIGRIMRESRSSFYEMITMSAFLMVTSGLCCRMRRVASCGLDRKSTRLNSSHGSISYAVFCLKKKIYKNAVAQTIYNEYCIK